MYTLLILLPKITEFIALRYAWKEVRVDFPREGFGCLGLM